MDGFSVDGPRILFEIAGYTISETIVVQWGIMAFLVVAAIVMTRKLELVPRSVGQHIAEVWVTGCRDLVEQAMEKKNMWFTPYVLALLPFLFFCNTVGLIGIRTPTADLNTTIGLSLMTFVMIHAFNIYYNGLGSYIKAYFEPLFFLFPLNITGELAKPISLSFRLFGNLLGGSIIMSLIYAALSGVLWGFARYGIPIVLHFYFDLFSGALQAFIFTMLTMVFIAIGIG